MSSPQVLSRNVRNLDLFSLAVIVCAISFGTVLGFTILKWSIQLDLPWKMEAMLITLVILASYIARLVSKTVKSKPSDHLHYTKSNGAMIKQSELSSKATGSGIHLLESKFINDPDIKNPFTRAVAERKKAFGIESFDSNDVKIEEFYKAVYGKCCESVVGSLRIPVGVVGPLPLVGSELVRFVNVPLATVEGALVASVNRGCKALRQSYEQDPLNLSCIVSQGHRKGITRGPCFRAPTIEKAAEFLNSLHAPNNFKVWRQVFDQSSPGGHIKLIEIRGRQIGFHVYVRVRADTSEAMGMNMVSRGCELLFDYILNNLKEFDGIVMESLSGNYCVDKKPAAINFIEGRGQEVVASARISNSIAKQVFGIEDIESLVKLNLSKNIIGSAAAGSIGGFNAQVANVVAAIYLSTGQDVAQLVDATQSITLFEYDRPTDTLIATLTMPCVEVGVRGGGTGLPHQKQCLQMILGGAEGDEGGSVEELARCVGLTTLAGELSLLASLQSGTLVASHFKLNH